MEVAPTIKDAVKLLMQGEEALTHVSMNGMKVDMDYLKGQQDYIIKECDKLKNQFLNETELGKVWLSKYGFKTDIDSSSQIIKVLDAYGFDKFKYTEKGNKSADKSVLEKLPYDTSSLLLKRNQLKILWQSLIKSVIKEADENGFIHPNFNLHTVRTYRSSCDAPNLQQMPKNNEMQKKIVRNGFIPRSPERQLMEIDLQSAEVTVGCCLHKDPTMLKFLQDKSTDMHKTVALKYYGLTPEDLDSKKKIRNSVKGRFIFASFYGSAAKSIAESLWEYISEQNPETSKGVKLADHMAKQGVTNFDTCLAHTEKIFNWYWNDLFHEYGKWKENIWETYKSQGYLDFPTGFRVTAKMTKTQSMNIVIQGSTFHLLLATLIELNKRILHYRLKSQIVGQIHDSIVLDVFPDEVPTICDLYLDSQSAVRKRWHWLIHAINADADIGELGGSWANMHEYGLLHHSL